MQWFGNMVAHLFRQMSLAKQTKNPKVLSLERLGQTITSGRNHELCPGWDYGMRAGS